MIPPKQWLPPVIGTLIGIGIGLGIANVAQPLLSSDAISEQVRKFRLVLEQANRNYVDNVQPQKLTESAIKAMLSELDPHSVYIPAEQREREDDDFRGNFEGIGVYFEIVNDTITVISPITEGPSEKAGIIAGDKIVRINGQSAVGISDKEVMKRLKGQRGSRVVLGIKRINEKNLLEIPIIRDRIPIYSVEAHFMIEGTDIGYISINRFAATTFDEFTKAARNLKQQGMQKLILDLRRNPGGYLEQSYEIADAFIPAGQKIVYTKGRQAEFNDEYVATAGGEFEKLPLIVLIDEGSASASEIVAGAIQDLDRGLIVGETSFGKGLVQRPYDLPDRSQYRLTISRYYTPSGRSIQRPYKNVRDYKNLAGRPELEEGENINHNQPKEQTDSTDAARPVFRTLGGRKVYGGGGIVPDYIVKSDTATPLMAQLVSKGVLRGFCEDYLARHSERLRKAYKNGAGVLAREKSGFADFAKNFAVTDDMLNDLKVLAERKGISWNVDYFRTDELFIRTRIKASIARALWNLNEENMIEASVDKQIQRAIQLFPEAKKIAKMY
jgi:carboxyl-terminal processing protease